MPLIPVLIAVFLVGASGTAVVANDAKPGDSLFKLDQFVERLETKFVFDEEAKVKLMTSLSQERLAELEAIQEAKVEGSADAEAKWEEHKADAMARVAASIERLNQLQAKFQTRLDVETDPKAKARLEKILSHLQLVEERRGKLLDKIEDREFKGDATEETTTETSIKSGQGSVKSQLKANARAWLNLSGEEKAEIHQELRDEFRFKFDDDNDEDDDEVKVEVNSSNSGSGKLIN